MVYDLPPPISAEMENDPVTLKGMIKATQTTLSQPILDDKFQLASTLANALLEFHMVGWLHKDLTSSNIIFCPRDYLPTTDMAREPYIIGFNHSRPDEISAFTEGPSTSGNDDYQHPEYRRDKRGYRQEYDYYSLGIVLLEIGLWKTINDWTPKWNLPAEELKQKLLRSRVPVLGQFMGRSYREAVRACLTGEFGVSEVLEESEKKIALQVSFKRLVVDRLRKRLD
jgi:serine/threonine protein kinase